MSTEAFSGIHPDRIGNVHRVAHEKLGSTKVEDSGLPISCVQGTVNSQVHGPLLVEIATTFNRLSTVFMYI